MLLNSLQRPGHHLSLSPQKGQQCQGRDTALRQKKLYYADILQKRDIVFPKVTYKTTIPLGWVEGEWQEEAGERGEEYLLRFPGTLFCGTSLRSEL